MNSTNTSDYHERIHFKRWTRDDFDALPRARALGNLADLAISIARRAPDGVDMISGPISTGPGRTTSERFAIFSRGVEKLAENPSLDVLSQVPFEMNIKRYAEVWKAITRAKDGEYCWPILNVFYTRLFASGCVRSLHFMPGYELSVGAKWEHDNAPRWGIARVYLPQNFTDNIVRELMSLAQ